MEPYEVDIEEVYLIFLEESWFFVALNKLYALTDEILLVVKNISNTSDHEISITELIVIGLTEIHLLTVFQHLPIDFIQYLRTQRGHLVQIRQQTIDQLCQSHMWKHLDHFTRVKYLK